MKWIAVGAAVVIVVLVVLLREITSSAPAAPARPTTEAPVRSRTGDVALAPPSPASVAYDAAFVPLEDDTDAAADGPIRPRSEAFWERVDHLGRQELPRLANDCYRGGQDRKAKLKLSYQLAIVGGQLSYHDVKVEESTLTDKQLEACMVRAIAGARFADPRMPDFTSLDTERETTLIRIEGLKRFRSERKDGND